MISLQPIITRLAAPPQGFKPLWFRQVDGAAAYALLRPDTLPYPAAWVVRASDRAARQGERSALATPEFDVVIAIENTRRHALGETDEILLAYRQAVFTLLEGWQAAAHQQPIRWQGGKVVEYTAQDLFWADRYAFDGLVTNYLGNPPAFDQLVYTGEKP